MEKVKIQVLEDDVVTGRLICGFMNNAGYMTVGPDMTYNEAKNTFEIERPNIIVANIFLFGKCDGIIFAEYVKSKANIPIIFITSTISKDILERAKKVFPSAYINKPLNSDILISSVEVALNNFSQVATSGLDTIKKVGDAFLIKSGSIFRKVFLDDVLYIISDSVYNVIHVKGSHEYLSRGRIKDFADIFPDSLIQVNRSVVINYKYISLIDEGGVFVEDKFFPVSCSFRKALMCLFFKF